MKIIKPKKKLNFDPERCNDVLVELVEVFQKHKPTVGEIILALGNLCYTLGASIGKHSQPGPSVAEIQKLYYEHPERIDIALMAQGTLLSSWFGDWEELQTKDKKDTKEEE